MYLKNGKIRKNIISVLAKLITFMIAISTNTYAQTAGGGYTDAYLLRDVGARAIGMGGAFTAVSNDPSTVFYNPAGLSDLPDYPVINSMFSILEHKRTHSALCWGQAISENIGLGFGINSFTSGSFISRDVKGTHIKHISVFDYSISASASYKLEFASMGITAKYLANTLQGMDYSSSGMAFDIGSKFNILDLFSFGLVVQNVGGFSSWNTKTEESNYLPIIIRTGFAFEFALNENEYNTRSTVTGEEETMLLPASRFIVVDLDAKFVQYETSPSISLGVEIIPHEVIGFRGGIDLYGNDMGKGMLFPMNNWGAGVSIRPLIEDLPFLAHIDYSVGADYLSLSKVAHHLSLYLEF